MKTIYCGTNIIENFTIGSRFLRVDVNYSWFDTEKRVPIVSYEIVPKNIDKIK